MRKEILKPAPGADKTIKLIRVLIDEKTIVTMRNIASFEHWQKRFPEARILN